MLIWVINLILLAKLTIASVVDTCKSDLFGGSTIHTLTTHYRDMLDELAFNTDSAIILLKMEENGSSKTEKIVFQIMHSTFHTFYIGLEYKLINSKPVIESVIQSAEINKIMHALDLKKFDGSLACKHFKNDAKIQVEQIVNEFQHRFLQMKSSKSTDAETTTRKKDASIHETEHMVDKSHEKQAGKSKVNNEVKIVHEQKSSDDNHKNSSDRKEDTKKTMKSKENTSDEKNEANHGKVDENKHHELEHVHDISVNSEKTSSEESHHKHVTESSKDKNDLLDHSQSSENYRKQDGTQKLGIEVIAEKANSHHQNTHSLVQELSDDNAMKNQADSLRSRSHHNDRKKDAVSTKDEKETDFHQQDRKQLQKPIEEIAKVTVNKLVSDDNLVIVQNTNLIESNSTVSNQTLSINGTNTTNQTTQSTGNMTKNAVAAVSALQNVNNATETTYKQELTDKKHQPSSANPDHTLTHDQSKNQTHHHNTSNSKSTLETNTTNQTQSTNKTDPSVLVLYAGPEINKLLDKEHNVRSPINHNGKKEATTVITTEGDGNKNQTNTTAESKLDNNFDYKKTLFKFLESTLSPFYNFGTGISVKANQQDSQASNTNLTLAEAHSAQSETSKPVKIEARINPIKLQKLNFLVMPHHAHPNSETVKHESAKTEEKHNQVEITSERKLSQYHDEKAHHHHHDERAQHHHHDESAQHHHYDNHSDNLLTHSHTVSDHHQVKESLKNHSGHDETSHHLSKKSHINPEEGHRLYQSTRLLGHDKRSGHKGSKDSSEFDYY